jgi:hypothetical protein
MRYFCEICGEIYKPDKIETDLLVCPYCGDYVHEVDDDITEDELFEILTGSKTGDNN